MEKLYIQITSGRGPVECCRVVVLIMQKIIEDANQWGMSAEIAEHQDGPQNGCMFSATLVVTGEKTEAFAKKMGRLHPLGSPEKSLSPLA